MRLTAPNQLFARFFVATAATGLVSIRSAYYNALFILADTLRKTGRIAAFGADAAVPGVLFIPLFTAFGADASVPCVLFIPFFAAGLDSAM